MTDRPVLVILAHGWSTARATLERMGATHLTQSAPVVDAAPIGDAAPPASHRRALVLAILAGLVVISLLAAGLFAARHFGYLGGASTDHDMTWFVLPDVRDEPTQAWSITAPGAGSLVQVLGQDADHLVTHRSSDDTAPQTVALINARTGDTVWERDLAGRGGPTWVVGIMAGGHPVLERVDHCNLRGSSA